MTTVHEYSHAISSTINPNHICENKIIFTEIDTIFMELIASDFVSKQFNDCSNTICNGDKLNEYIYSANILKIIINLINDEKNFEDGYANNKEFKKIAKEKYQISSEIVDDIICNPNLNNIIYLNGYMFAIELYKIYKQDKEKALHYLKKIILLENMNDLEYYNNILKLGIIPNFSLKEYYENIKNDAIKLTRKKDVYMN